MNFSKFKNVKVAVIGDLIADSYVYAETSRISREAPVLILKETKREISPGGAANLAMNIKAMGGQVTPIGSLGIGPHGGSVWKQFERVHIPVNNLILDERNKGRSIVKMRIMAGSHNTVSQQMLRIDRKPDALSQVVREKLTKSLNQVIGDVDALLVSDYGEGTIDNEMISLINEIALRKPVLVDSRYRIAKFENAFALVPNVDELRAATLNNDLDVAVNNLRARTSSQAILVTQGKNGLSVYANTDEVWESKHFEAYGSDEIADVTGAGDTVLSAFSLAVLSGESTTTAALLANIAGGIQVMKSGTAVVTNSELLGHWSAYHSAQTAPSKCNDPNCESKGCGDNCTC